jgi:Sec-independent protein translocase protein TatA
MEIFGIGPLEVLFILLLAFIVLGPGDMAKTGRTIGRFLRKVVTSQWWSGFRNASREIKQLPFTLMREASIEEAAKDINELNKIGENLTISTTTDKKSDFSGWINPSILSRDTPNDPESINTKSGL